MFESHSIFRLWRKTRWTQKRSTATAATTISTESWNSSRPSRIKTNRSNPSSNETGNRTKKQNDPGLRQQLRPSPKKLPPSPKKTSTVRSRKKIWAITSPRCLGPNRVLQNRFLLWSPLPPPSPPSPRKRWNLRNLLQLKISGRWYLLTSLRRATKSRNTTLSKRRRRPKRRNRDRPTECLPNESLPIRRLPPINPKKSFQKKLLPQSSHIGLKSPTLLRIIPSPICVTTMQTKLISKLRPKLKNSTSKTNQCQNSRDLLQRRFFQTHHFPSKNWRLCKAKAKTKLIETKLNSRASTTNPSWSLSRVVINYFFMSLIKFLKKGFYFKSYSVLVNWLIMDLQAEFVNTQLWSNGISYGNFQFSIFIEWRSGRNRIILCLHLYFISSFIRISFISFFRMGYRFLGNFQRFIRYSVQNCIL